MTEPTDEQLEAFFVEETGFSIDDFPAAILDFARAVLAKWGTPAGAGEPVAEVISTNGLEAEFTCEMLHGHVPALGAGVYLATPQPTQAQAGAVPLTQYRVLEPRVDRIEAGDEFLQDDAQTWAIDPNGTFVGTIYGYALRAARRRIAKKEGVDHG